MSVRELLPNPASFQELPAFCPFRCSYPFTPGGFKQLREEVRTELRHHCENEERIDDAVIAIMEVAGNFLQYAQQATHVAVEIQARSGVCYVIVSHNGMADDPAWLEKAERELAERLRDTNLPYRQGAYSSATERRSLGCGLHLIKTCCGDVRADSRGLCFVQRVH